MEELGKRPAGAEKEVELPARKKGKKGSARGKDAHEAVEVSPHDYVRVVPYRKPTADDDVGPTVLLSKVDKAPQLTLSDDRCSVTGSKGFRTVRATHGSHVGTYYCEATVQHLGPTGHCRLGWSTKKAEINAPVGYDQFGCGYRDLEGSKVHKALREEYGQAFGENDVIGLFIHLPEGGRPMEAKAQEVVRYKGMLMQVQEDEQEPKPLLGSVVGFSKNGAWQGIAYRDLLEGSYYPSVSLFTLPEQSSGATVSLNFGPEFKFPPPAVEGCPAAEPVSVLAARAAAAEAAAAAELMAVAPQATTAGEEAVTAAALAAAPAAPAPALDNGALQQQAVAEVQPEAAAVVG